MTSDPELIRILDVWLTDGATIAPAHTLDALRARLAETPRRPTPLQPLRGGRPDGMSRRARLVAAGLVVALAGALVIGVMHVPERGATVLPTAVVSTPFEAPMEGDGLPIASLAPRQTFASASAPSVADPATTGVGRVTTALLVPLSFAPGSDWVVVANGRSYVELAYVPNWRSTGGERTSTWSLGVGLPYGFRSAGALMRAVRAQERPGSPPMREQCPDLMRAARAELLGIRGDVFYCDRFDATGPDDVPIYPLTKAGHDAGPPTTSKGLDDWFTLHMADPAPRLIADVDGAPTLVPLSVEAFRQDDLFRVDRSAVVVTPPGRDDGTFLVGEVGGRPVVISLTGDVLDAHADPGGAAPHPGVNLHPHGVPLPQRITTALDELGLILGS